MQKQKYTIYACLIISFATYSFSLKEANQLVIDYQESMSLVSSYMVRKAQAEEVTNGFNRRMINKAQEPQEAVDEVLKVKETNYENSESLVVKAKPESIEDKIKAVFGENSEEMTELFTCESQLIPNKAGDLHLTFEHNGEILGSSHGLGQVRTGGNENGVVWNRAKKYGMSAKEFIKALEDPDFNLEISKKIYDSGGYYPWYNCSKKIGLIK